MLAQIGEFDVNLAINLIMGRGGDANATRLGDPLKPGSDVDTVPENIVRLDDYIADIYAVPEDNSLVCCVSGREISNAILKMFGCSNRFDRARELGKKTVASVLDDAASVLRNGWLDNTRKKRRQTGMRSLFVIVHEPRIAGHVGNHNCRQPASSP